MTAASWISAGISALTALAVWYMERRQKKRDKLAEENAEKRKRESLLSLEMMNANNKLSYALAMAVKRGYPNGEVEAALETYSEAESAYAHFKDELAAEAMASA